MGQTEAMLAAEGSMKIGGKALLADLAKEGGAVDLEIDALASSLGQFGPVMAQMLKPFVKQLLQTIAEKL